MILSRREVLERIEGVPVAVLGDLMLDEYLMGSIERISPEAPVPVVSLEERQFRLGGAGNVALNLAALGARPVVLAAVGDDEDGARVRQLMEQGKVDHRLVSLASRPTTRKTRVVVRNQHVVRLDQEVRQAVPDAALEQLARSLERLEVKLLILSDYGKGVVGRALAQRAIAWARERKIRVVVDPKSDDFTLYAGAHFATPNAREASLAARMPCGSREEAAACGRRLLKDTGGEGMLVTRGANGMALISASEAHFVSAHARSVFDVTGAGDTVIATFGAALSIGAEPAEAMALANFAAAVVVQRLGAATCTRDEIAIQAGIGPLDKEGGQDARLHSPGLLTLEQGSKLAERWRSEGKRVVFTNGCFDLLHPGHVVLLEEARSRGDALVVALNTDASVRRLKGKSRPVQTLVDRARVLLGLKAVDAVVSFDEETPLKAVLAIRPDVIVKGGDYQPSTIVGAREVEGWGGEVVVVSLVPNRSTTALLAKSTS